MNSEEFRRVLACEYSVIIEHKLTTMFQLRCVPRPSPVIQKDSRASTEAAHELKALLLI